MKDYSIIIKFVEQELSKDNSGHGLQHALRVFHDAQKIYEKEGGDEKIILSSALLHDTVDKKLFDNFEERIAYVSDFLKLNNYTDEEIKEIVYIISNISWNNGENKQLNNLNAKIVRDADRLDAIGAIGIVRTTEYGNSKHRDFYNAENLTLQDGKIMFNKVNNSTLSHFYEKLLLLTDLMHTETARQMANKRHQFMISFLDEFYDEL
ncbi:MAG: HD domain-containing protein [Clostridia bacterium]|nr:HD domain-containing protein [Clostridia bacterium]